MAVASQQAVAFCGRGHQQHYEMSISFLTGRIDKHTRTTQDYHNHTLAPAPVSAAAPAFPTAYHEAERLDMPITLPPLRLAGSACANNPYSSAQIPRIDSCGIISSIDSLGGADIRNSWKDGILADTDDTTMDSSSISTSPTKCHESMWKSSPTDSTSTSATSYHTGNSISDMKDPHTQYRHNCRPRPAQSFMLTEPLARISRPARSSYNEEQKFFIMYYRVIRWFSLPKIENVFAYFFNLRTRSGLTGVYYRTRKNWGMKEVLKSGLDSSLGDCDKVKARAIHFSHEFLISLVASAPGLAAQSSQERYCTQMSTRRRRRVSLDTTDRELSVLPSAKAGGRTPLSNIYTSAGRRCGMRRFKPGTRSYLVQRESAVRCFLHARIFYKLTWLRNIRMDVEDLGTTRVDKNRM